MEAGLEDLDLLDEAERGAVDDPEDQHDRQHANHQAREDQHQGGELPEIDTAVLARRARTEFVEGIGESRVVRHG